MKVAIIILNYNCWQDSIETIESVLKNDYSNFEIIVIDNYSSDDSWEKLSHWYNKQKNKALSATSKILLMKNEVNSGFAGGNNLGIKIALERGADYILILNPDVEVKPNFLTELMNWALKNKSKKIGFLGPRIFYYHNRNLIYSNGGKINWSLTKGELIDNGKDFQKLKTQNSKLKTLVKRFPDAYLKTQNVGNIEDVKDEPFKTDYVSGTALLVSKEVLKDIGLMDESFFLYYEDTEWALRASKKGYQHFIVPTSIIYHKESVSTGKFSYNYIYYHTRNALMMAKKHGNIFIKIYLIFFIIQKTLKQILKLIFIPSKRLWAVALLKGIFDFIKNKKGKL